MAVQYKDYYKVLGVERNADAKAIKQAYRRLARKWGFQPIDKVAHEGLGLLLGDRDAAQSDSGIDPLQNYAAQRRLFGWWQVEWHLNNLLQKRPAGHRATGSIAFA